MIKNHGHNIQETLMLKTKIISLALLLLSANIAAQAQTRKNAKKAGAEVEMTEEEEMAEELYETMLLSTAQVMFIDSVVVDSADFPCCCQRRR